MAVGSHHLHLQWTKLVLTACAQLTLTFNPDLNLSQKPMHYLFKAQSGAFCLGIFDNGDQGALIGGISVRNIVVQVCDTWGGAPTSWWHSREIKDSCRQLQLQIELHHECAIGAGITGP